MAKQRLTKHHRLLKPADFRRVFDCAERSRDKFFTVLQRPNTLGHYRLGLAISKKTDKRAVGRNRIKRQVREIFRCTIPAELDYVVISNLAAATASSAELRDSMARHFSILIKKRKPREK